MFGSGLSFILFLASAVCSAAFHLTTFLSASSVVFDRRIGSPFDNGSTRNSFVLRLSLASAANAARGALKSVLKKPSKVLTVCLEYDAVARKADNEPSLTPLELETLSMQLRKVKAGALFTSDLDAIASFAKEQEAAKGNFPGPCPVVFAGTPSHIEEAISAGASAVVLDVDVLSGNRAAGLDEEVVWRVSSAEDAIQISEALGENADKSCFLVDCGTLEAASETLDAIPKAAAAIAALDAMQPDDAEVEAGRALKKSGCASILIRSACVGEEEDVEYCNFVVEGLTSKKSSEFNFSGLTGSANGHFGGVASSGKSKWKRIQH